MLSILLFKRRIIIPNMSLCFLSTLCASSPPLKLPSPMETHLWCVMPDEVKSESLLNKYMMQVLSPIEKQYVLSMPDDYQLRKRVILARALVRTTIAKYQINRYGDPKSLRFKKNIHGKPVEWESEDGWCPPPLQFNISHTSSLIACGVTLNSQVGIDVEEKQRKIKNNVLAFARRYFSPHEVEYLSAISDSEVQRQEFIKLWTLKEAYVKALGKGFSASPFKSFTIRRKTATREGQIVRSQDLDSEASEITVESFDDPKDLATNWQFALLELATSHYVAICMEKDRTNKIEIPMKLTALKTIPLVEDEHLFGTDFIVPIEGFVKLI